MKRNFYLVFVIFAFVIFSIATAVAQPSQLTKAVNFRTSYIPIEIQNGFVLDSVVCTYDPGFSQFNSFHFKYNSSGQLIWEDDIGVLLLSSFNSYGHKVNVYFQLFSDNSYNEKGLLSLQSVHYVDSTLRDWGSSTYSYDSDNRIISVITVEENGDTATSTLFQYDSSGSLTGYHHNISDVIHTWSIMEYDSLGRIKSRLDSQFEYPNEYFYDYDSKGGVICTVVDSMYQNIPPIDTLQVHHFEYDGSGRELLDIWGWGTGDTSSYARVVSTYDGSGKILSIIDSPYDPYNFSYNSDNNLDSCVAGEERDSYFEPGGILLYDQYGNAFLEGFESGYRGLKIFPYYSNLSSMGITNSKSAPRDFYLSQNYPNPFNPTMVINYQLPVASNVVLKIYDVLGREVETLVDGRQTGGTHLVTFRADNLPSGVYFYSITAGAFHQVRKMVLVK